jgi:hypothetical protein
MKEKRMINKFDQLVFQGVVIEMALGSKETAFDLAEKYQNVVADLFTLRKTNGTPTAKTFAVVKERKPKNAASISQIARAFRVAPITIARALRRFPVEPIYTTPNLKRKYYERQAVEQAYAEYQKVMQAEKQQRCRNMVTEWNEFKQQRRGMRL